MYITYLFALAGPRVANHVKETTPATYAFAYTRPYRKTGTEKLKRNGEIKTKREYVRNGPFRSSPVHYPFATLFFKWAPIVRIERGTLGTAFLQSY